MSKLKFTKMAAFPGFPTGLRANVDGLGEVELYYLGNDRVSVELAETHKTLAVVDNMTLAQKQLRELHEMKDQDRKSRIVKQLLDRTAYDKKEA